ncbi:hypothetical protein BKA82DRAFT_4020046 [Pisolithus tinctorius]|nr:hypothetical protein BKA82DRAFT_4020046 [Pisolithus tinctorius]
MSWLDTDATLDHVEKIVLAAQYGTDEWLLRSLLALAKKPDPISVEEGRRLGLEDCVEVGIGAGAADGRQSVWPLQLRQRYIIRGKAHRDFSPEGRAMVIMPPGDPEVASSEMRAVTIKVLEVGPPVVKKYLNGGLLVTVSWTDEDRPADGIWGVITEGPTWEHKLPYMVSTPWAHRAILHFYVDQKGVYHHQYCDDPVWTRNPWDLGDTPGSKVGVVESQVHAREIVARALSKIADYFGADVILLDGSLDHKKLGSIVFNGEINGRS